MSTKKRRAARTPRTGRPPNRPGEPGSRVLRAWVTEGVHLAATEQAKGAGVSLSAWVRALVEREIEGGEG